MLRTRRSLWRVVNYNKPDSKLCYRPPSALGLALWCCLPANRSRLSTHRPITQCALATLSLVPNRPPRVLVLGDIGGFSCQVNNMQRRRTLFMLCNTPQFPRFPLEPSQGFSRKIQIMFFCPLSSYLFFNAVICAATTTT